MEPIVIPEVESYLYSLLPRRDAVLAEMEEQARQRSIPIVGPAVGRVLYQYAQLIGARRIFEMGSAIGYSTLWLARAAGAEGTVFYTDGDPKNAAEARGYFERAGVGDRIEIKVGNSLDLIAQTDGPFDLIFNDVNKDQYPDVLPLVLPRLRRGGLFITDNVFWSGRVGRTLRSGDRETPAILRFNQMLYQTPELFVTLLPLRDGLAVCHKV
jgi:predicted O-methyltransferase YrrM